MRPWALAAVSVLATMVLVGQASESPPGSEVLGDTSTTGEGVRTLITELIGEASVSEQHGVDLLKAVATKLETLLKSENVTGVGMLQEATTAMRTAEGMQPTAVPKGATSESSLTLKQDTSKVEVKLKDTEKKLKDTEKKLKDTEDGKKEADEKVSACGENPKQAEEKPKDEQSKKPIDPSWNGPAFRALFAPYCLDVLDRTDKKKDSEWYRQWDRSRDCRPLGFFAKGKPHKDQWRPPDKARKLAEPPYKPRSKISMELGEEVSFGRRRKKNENAKAGERRRKSSMFGGGFSKLNDIKSKFT